MISFSKEEILTELNNHPEHFSPNVILRPLYQQKTLPSLAYIGGGGELSYWLQLKTLFHYHQINFPQLILRNSALLMNTSIVQKIDKLNLTIIDFFNTIDTLKKHFITQNTKEDLDVSVYKQAIENTFVNLQQLTKEIDASLINTVGAEMQKALQSVDSLQKRLMKSLKQKNETSLNQMEKINSESETKTESESVSLTDSIVQEQKKLIEFIKSEIVQMESTKTNAKQIEKFDSISIFNNYSSLILIAIIIVLVFITRK